jgi:hypothetical protein
MPEPQSYQEAVGGFADEAATLQAKVNLHISWAVIASQPIPPELCDANAKLVDVARQLRHVAHQAAKVEASGQGIRDSERAAPHGA